MQNIACIGECMVELSSTTVLNPQNNEPLYQIGFGGDTLNASIYLARMGGNVSYISALGDDDIYSTRMIKAWEDENVDTSLVKRVKGELPGLYIITNDETGERTFEFWRMESPARRLFELDNTEDYFEKLSQFDNIFFSLITLSLYSKEALDKFYNFLLQYKGKGGRIIIDNNYRKSGWASLEEASTFYRKFAAIAHVVLPSFDDEITLMQFKSNKECIEYYKSKGVEEVVIKNGGGLVTIFHNGKVEEVTVSKIEKVVDTTAAGDSFAGVYLAGRLADMNPVDAVKRAHSVASQVILHKGAIMPKEFMNS